MAYELIETITLTSSASSIEFTSIPQDGTDLLMLCSVRQTVNSNMKPTINGADFTSGILLGGDGAAAYSLALGLISTSNNDDTASTFGNASIYIPNYTSSVAKSASADGVSEHNGTEAFQSLTAFTSTDTNPVTSFGIVVQASGDFVAGSTASLFKIS